MEQQQADEQLAVMNPGVLKLEPAPLNRRVLTRHGSLQPQENDDDDEPSVQSEKDIKDRPRRLSDRGQANDTSINEPLSNRCATTLLPEVERICLLTQCLTNRLQRDEWTQQELEDEQDQDNDEDHTDAVSLASLYCQRAAALLEYAKFDASVRIPLVLLESMNPQVAQSDSVLSIASDGWCAVKQALEDAVLAIANDTSGSEAYYLAAQSHCSLGNPEAAVEMVQNALRLTRQQKKLHTLMRQLLRVTSTTSRGLSPPLLCRVPHTTDQSDDNDHLSAEITRRFHAMQTISDSPLLHSLESMMHEVRHHQCATNDKARALAVATSDTIAFLRLLLEDTTTTAFAIGLEARILHDVAQLLTDVNRIMDSQPMRRWFVKTLAPAVVQNLRTSVAIVNGTVSSRPAILRDVLVTLTRLLLATGSLQRCTNEPHAIATSKLAYDLTKQLTTHSPEFVRLELACKDAYALALLDLADEAGEALVLHQETLDKAIQYVDSDRELRSRHLLGRALVHLGEFDTAKIEFTTLLQQSEALGDSAVECLSLCLLGECHIATGDMDDGMQFFKRALIICNQTAHCYGTWRPASIERAIDFYSCLLRPVRRRPAMRRNDVEIKPRKATLVVNPSGLGTPDANSWTWDDEPELPQRRRGGMRMESPLVLADTSNKSAPRRTLMETVIGRYNGDVASEEDTSETTIESEDEEERTGPLTTYGVSLSTWLISQNSTRSTYPACCKPVA